MQLMNFKRGDLITWEWFVPGPKGPVPAQCSGIVLGIVLKPYQDDNHVEVLYEGRQHSVRSDQCELVSSS